MGFGFGRTTATALAVFTLILLSVSSIFYVSGIPVLMELGAEGLFTFLLFATYFGHLKPYLQSGPREHVPNNQKLPSPRLAGRTGVKGLADGICLCPPPFGSVRKQCCAPVSVSRPCRLVSCHRVDSAFLMLCPRVCPPSCLVSLSHLIASHCVGPIPEERNVHKLSTDLLPSNRFDLPSRSVLLSCSLLYDAPGGVFQSSSVCPSCVLLSTGREETWGISSTF